MTTNCIYIFTILFYISSALKLFQPREIIHLLENSCLLAVLVESDDVFLPGDTGQLLRSLSEVSFQSEPFVQFGYINLKSFRWQNNQTLQTIKREHPSVNDIVLFPKSKVDRTCLLPAKPLMPKVNVYKGSKSINLLVDFINNYCGTYRTVKGSVSYEGLHREEILKNLFSVSSISYVTSNYVFQEQVVDESCDKNTNKKENIICDDKHDHQKSFQKTINQKQHEIPKCDRIKVPSKDDFFHDYLKLSRPVIIEGAMESWPAMTKWSNKFLREEYGDNKAHIKLTPRGEFEGVESSELWDNYKTFRIPEAVQKQLEFSDLVVVRPATLSMKFSELVDLIEKVSDGVVNNVSAYLEYSSIPNHLPELEDDIREMPFIIDVLNRQHLNIWFSDGNTLGKLHFDPFDNFLCQISGQKQVLLFEPHDNTRLYESHIPEAMLAYNHSTKQFTRNQLAQSTSMVMSPVDIKKVDFKRFPKFAGTYPLNCTLNEGDVLFMPSFWWHEVQSVPNRKEKRNLAVNYWYEPFLTKEFPCPTCKLDVNPKYRHLL
ncbi:jmjC domain-containing protein E-like [Mytilus edulis]|uniref:jmjC domain-containing protein E-like n=1 Tax=Mytilus edulis TaxID=6550 RepID=UPI0039EE78CD